MQLPIQQMPGDYPFQIVQVVLQVGSSWQHLVSSVGSELLKLLLVYFGLKVAYGMVSSLWMKYVIRKGKREKQ